MRKAAKHARRFFRRIWQGFREWSGDAAYESYLRSHSVHRMSPAEFYVEQLHRRYSRPNRCC